MAVKSSSAKANSNRKVKKVASKQQPTKNTSGLRTFLNKLNPNTPAKKLLAFVLVFAVLGGGYYAYRSFASTNMTVENAVQMAGGEPVYTTVNNKRVMVERKLSSYVTATLSTTTNKSRVCINLRNKSSSARGVKVIIAPTTKVVKVSGNTGGWYDTGHALKKTGSNSIALVSIRPESGLPNGNLSVRQIATVKNMGSCPK